MTYENYSFGDPNLPPGLSHDPGDDYPEEANEGLDCLYCNKGVIDDEDCPHCEGTGKVDATTFMQQRAAIQARSPE